MPATVPRDGSGVQHAEVSRLCSQAHGMKGREGLGLPCIRLGLQRLPDLTGGPINRAAISKLPKDFL